MYSGPMGLVFKIAKLISALAALNIGLAAAGIFDFFTMESMLMNPSLRMGVQYAIGLSGALTLVGLAMHVMYCSGKKECM